MLKDMCPALDVIINDKMYDYWHEELEFSLRTWT